MERTVKQIAERVGLPGRTLRYYDRIGLVSPEERSPSGYRLYGPEDEGKLHFVREAKGLGLSLREIRELMLAAESGSWGELIPKLDRLVTRKVAELERKIADLRSLQERLAAYRAAEEEEESQGRVWQGLLSAALDRPSGLAAAFQNAPLTEGQRAILWSLLLDGPLSLHEMAERIRTTRPQGLRKPEAFHYHRARPALLRLERRGLVERQGDDRARSGQQFAITPHGEKLLQLTEPQAPAPEPDQRKPASRR